MQSPRTSSSVPVFPAPSASAASARRSPLCVRNGVVGGNEMGRGAGERKRAIGICRLHNFNCIVCELKRGRHGTSEFSTLLEEPMDSFSSLYFVSFLPPPPPYFFRCKPPLLLFAHCSVVPLLRIRPPLPSEEEEEEPCFLSSHLEALLVVAYKRPMWPPQNKSVPSATPTLSLHPLRVLV